MAAIWGIVSKNKKIKPQSAQIREVYNRKAKLDNIMEWADSDCFFGVGCIYVHEYDEKEQMPIADENLVFAADCILDNREEVIKQICKSEAEETASLDLPDGELIYRLFCKYGTECFKQLRGLFSISVYDKNTGKIILASDPVASRCLYYCLEDNAVVFSTLIDGILAYTGKKEYDRQYIEDFLMTPGLMPNLMSDNTPYEGIKKLNPGVWLEIKDGYATEHEYFDMSEKLVDCKCKNAKQYGTYFRKLFDRCVSDAVNTKGEVAVAMSSGLDSASIGVLAAQSLERMNKKLHSFTYVPAINVDEKDYFYFILDETADVKKIATPYSNMELNFVNNDGKNCFEDMPFVVDRMEIPFKAFANFPNLCEIFEKASNKGCKIVLTGQTGNGSVSYGNIDDVLFEYYLKKRFCKMFFTLNTYSKTVGESRKKAFLGCLGYFSYAKKILKEGIGKYEKYNPFLKDDFVENYSYKERFKLGGLNCIENIPMNSQHHIAFLTKKSMYTYMGEYETKLGLAYGVIIRDPTKDARMLRFCYSLPYGLFTYKGTPRWLIRGNMRDVLPTDLLDKWMRYGVQNADYFLRVKRDWNNIIPLFEKNEELVPDFYKEYVDKDKEKKYLEEINNLPEDESESRFDYLGYAYILRCFLLRRE